MRKIMNHLISIVLSLCMVLNIIVAPSFGGIPQDTIDKILSEYHDDNITFDLKVQYRQDLARTMLDMINNLRTGTDENGKPNAWMHKADAVAPFTEEDREYIYGLEELTYDYALETYAMQRVPEVLAYINDGHGVGSGMSPDGMFALYFDTGSASHGECACQYNFGELTFDEIAQNFEILSEAYSERSRQRHRFEMLWGGNTRVGIAAIQTQTGFDIAGKPTYANSIILVFAGDEFENQGLSSDIENPIDTSWQKKSIPFSATYIQSLTNTIDINVVQNTYFDMPIEDLYVEAEVTNPDSPSITRTLWLYPQYDWVISNTDIAEIVDGKIFGKKVGTTSISALLGDGYTDETTGECVEAPTITIPITVCETDISSGSFVFSDELTTYNNYLSFKEQDKEYIPEITFTLNDKTLTENDYTVSCEVNSSKGGMFVTVKGIDQYTGSVTKFLPCEHSYNNIVINPTCTEDGKAYDVCKYCNYTVQQGPYWDKIITEDVPESPHPEYHEEDLDDYITWPYCYRETQSTEKIEIENATSYEITFSEDTFTEYDEYYLNGTYTKSQAMAYEKIVIYGYQDIWSSVSEYKGSVIGRYLGCELAGQTIEIPEKYDSFYIVIESNQSSGYSEQYGYKVDKIVAHCEKDVEKYTATGHTEDTPVDEIVIPATCETNGVLNTVTYCIDCGIEMNRTEDVIAATGHNYGKFAANGNKTHSQTCSNIGCENSVITNDCVYSYEIITDATYTQTGIGRYICSVCMDYYDEVIPLKPCPHANTEIINDVSAGCETEGYTGDTHCNDCKKIIEYGITIDALGHEEGNPIEIITIKPTCTEEGEVTITTKCKNCTLVLNESAKSIDALGHTEIIVEEITTPATCETEGSKIVTTKCEVCDEVFDETIAVVEAMGHNCNKITVGATCTTHGYISYICVNCGEETVESYFKPTGHNFEYTVIEPTCTEQGYNLYKCTNMYCNESYNSDYIDALGHKYDTGVITTQPTYDEVGIKTYTCSVCQNYYTQDIPKLEKTGWFKENGKWAYYVEDIKLTNKWMRDSVGWCYLGADGYMTTNQWIMDSVGWCYVGADGYCLTNTWMADSQGWCYLGSDGYCINNSWKRDSIGWCYIGADGRMATNRWVRDSVGWCYVGSNGYCIINSWKKDSIGWCYLNADGRMATNQWVRDSVGWCYVGSDGRMVTNQWIYYGNNWYYIDRNGYMVTGRRQINGTTYSFNSNGVLVA